ncbi:helix-turn-helix domain-containing protein [Nocardia sp. alder85J]|uniref:helix-turn-helix domain-containing protein n=1 Tax=Nocardia sp. alder85J TaxID=2862949 RepID=UPI001CD2DCCC|nr:helix-turn-helix domain-containing protein [Nocardia sp. alder85J]MCX4098034.1 helix-turn-helix domain-containing protein [Nocardia sp. alder85J]
MAARIPTGFFETPQLRTALGSYDFGAVFLAVRQQADLSQTELGELLEISQSRISAVERNERGIGHVKVVARVATRLGIPAHLLGFAAGSAGNLADKEVSWVDRRDFLVLLTAATLGSNLHPELARLGNQLPGQAVPSSRTHIGASDIDAIENITDGFRRWDLAHGGGLCRSAALTQLHQVRALQKASCPDDLRPRLLIATAELASMAGWLAYDVEDHDAARKLWTYALDAAHQGEDHPRSTDLTVSVLLDMAHQSLHLDRPDEALKVTQLAQATAGNRKHPAAVSTDAYVFAVLGWCRATQGEVEPTKRALGQSEDRYDDANSAPVPSWARCYRGVVSDAEITAQQGYAMHLLSKSQPDFAPVAVAKLGQAVSGYENAHARSRAVNLPPLASAQFRTGDVDTAVVTGYQAISAIGNVSSARCYARLRDLSKAAQPFAARSEVADLRADIRAAVPLAV